MIIISKVLILHQTFVFCQQTEAHECVQCDTNWMYGLIVALDLIKILTGSPKQKEASSQKAFHQERKSE